jgi:hypothetical protein
MRTLLFAAAVMGLAALTGCSSASPSGSTGTHPADAGADDAAEVVDTAAPLPATWTAVYGAYFASGTPGHCGNAGCHATTRGGFRCGATKDTCYQGLVNASLISVVDPATSLISDAQSSPLAWFGGNMPQDNPGPNADAAAALKAWVVAGAKND